MLRQPHPARRRRSSARALFAAVATVLPVVLPATQAAAFVPDRTWVGASGGSWALASNWSPSGIPGSSESITIIGTISAYTVNYNGSYTTPTGTAAITLDATPTNSLTFNQIVTNNLYSSSEFIGRTGGRSTYSQPFGSNTVGGNLVIGYGGAATGTYSLSGTGILLAGEEYLAASGVGTVTQTGGSHTVSTTVNNMSTLHIGWNAGSSGSYALSGGKLAAVNLFVGENGAGTFVQTGGTNAISAATFAVTNTLSATLSIGRYAGSAGSYSLSGTGSLTAGTASLGGTTTAAGGTGNLTVSGGAASFAGAVTVWPSSRLTLTGGTLAAGSLTLNGYSTFDLSGGTFTAPLATQSAALFRFALSSGLAFSTAANADAQHRLAIGYTTNATTLTARLTYLGDANLDGKVNADDFALLDRGFAKHLDTWQAGDFNYDGSITSADYLLIDRVFTQQTGTLSPDFLAMRESQFGPDYVAQLVTSVPEPTSLACLFATLPFLPRRRKLS